MNNSRDGFSSVPNQTDLRTRPSGWRVPAFSSRNGWSQNDSIANRRPRQDPQTLDSRTAISPDNQRRHNLEALRQALHIQPARLETNSSQAKEEDNVLKHLTKETYNPPPRSLLLRNLSLYYRNKTRGVEKGFSGEEEEEDGEKSCTVCLEDFKPKETVMITPCKHMFHEECIVPWLKSKGQCPLCRFFIVKKQKEKRDSSPATTSSNLAGDDLFTLELISVVRAIEESFLFGYPHRL